MKAQIILSNDEDKALDNRVDLSQSQIKQSLWTVERRARAIMLLYFSLMIGIWLLTFKNVIIDWFAAHIVYNEYCTEAGYCTRSITYITYWWSYVFLVLPLIFQTIRVQLPQPKAWAYVCEVISLLLVVGVLTTWEKLDQYYLHDDNYAVLLALVFSIVIVVEKNKELLLIMLFWSLTFAKLYRSISLGLFWAYVFNRNFTLDHPMTAINFPSNFIIQFMKNLQQQQFQSLQQSNQKVVTDTSNQC